MKCYPLLLMAVIFCISAVANHTLADEQQEKVAPAPQAHKSDDEALKDAINALRAAKRESDFKECAAMLTEFMQKHPNPTLTERIEGHYLVAQCQEKQGQIDEAMVSYAKAVVAGEELAEDAIAMKAKERLEQLYRSFHNNLLRGIAKVYKIAKESMAQGEK